MSKKIVLVGYMGCGKSVVAKMISQIKGIDYLELDKIIEEKESLSIKDLFKNKGELYFRKQEHLLFAEIVSSNRNFILSTGGGTPCYYNNHLWLQNESVFSVYLKSSVQNLFDRLILEKAHRPLIASLQNDELKEFIAKHLFEREYYYRFAKATINVEGKPVTQIAQEIIDLLT